MSKVEDADAHGVGWSPATLAFEGYNIYSKVIRFNRTLPARLHPFHHPQSERIFAWKASQSGAVSFSTVMKLYTFEVNKQRRIGAEADGLLVDLAIVYEASARTPKPGRLRAIPREMLSFIRLGPLALEAARDAIGYLKKRPAVPVGEQLAYPFEAVKILAPIERPGKILGSLEQSTRDESSFFAKIPSAVIGPGESIIQPRLSERLDCGLHVAAVIGRRMKHTPEPEVMSSIFGYTLLHDVSAHDFQFERNRYTLAKNFDTFCPIGPCLVTANEIQNGANAQLRTYLNGKLQQSCTVADLISHFPRLLSFLSKGMTLEPGDIVSTCAPGGSISMQRGDTVAGEIDGIGRLENPVIAEQ